MNIAPAGMIGGLTPLNPVSQPTSTGGVFGSVVQNFIQDTNNQQMIADQQVELLATGQSDSVHETMLALAKADLSLRVFMEVRNKVIEAYQEVMRTPM
jgi:flagellar hook-basal body complex protein FliE